jgi:hypothetical protein
VLAKFADLPWSPPSTLVSFSSCHLFIFFVYLPALLHL